MILKDFRHDRRARFNDENRKLFRHIDEFGNSKKLDRLYKAVERAYGIPVPATTITLKNFIARQYSYQEARFRKSIMLTRLPVAVLRHLGALIYCLVFAKSALSKYSVTLLIDDVKSNIELERFERLGRLFGESERAFIATSKEVNAEKYIKGCHIFPYHRGYQRSIVLTSIWKEVFVNSWICLIVSLRIKTNLFPVLTHVALSYLRAESIYSNISARILIQERFYETNAIRNFVFKKHGGIAVANLQKNIVQLDRIFFFVDSDWLLALGHKSSERLFQYGARIERVIPVGSFFFERGYYRRDPQKTKEFNGEEIDILFIGSNVNHALDRLNSFDDFIEDYYSSMNWIVKLKKQHPNLRIAVKHHESYPDDDPIETEIWQGSDVEILRHSGGSFNTYEAAMVSRCCVTYASTMGYEMLGVKKEVIFFAPEGRNTFLPDERDFLKTPIFATNYDDFRMKVLTALQRKDGAKEVLSNPSDYCLVSDNVASRIAGEVFRACAHSDNV
ncbi:hypothetical protein OAR43_00475 [Gammaproteobacteria bacterium]|nr:hypothetical protein [Gammaproteobacteria bacterium]